MKEVSVSLPEKKVIIVGTAHVLPESVELVKKVIREEKPDVVAVELDEVRYASMMSEKKPKIDKKQLLNPKNFVFISVQYLLSLVQKKLGDSFGVEPGSELKQAIEEARGVGARVELVDRDIRITMSRMIQKMSFREKMRFVSQLFLGFFGVGGKVDLTNLSDEKIEDELMPIFKNDFPSVYTVLVEERDEYMAQVIFSLLPSCEKMVVVVGAGHKKGLAKKLSGLAGSGNAIAM
ncbi:MAG: TraB family protein [Candidatus Diapherotrites archaeon]|nr:TraB family protein [Candidatus Diapherotrites archaeon]